MRTSLGPSTRRAEGHARVSPQGAASRPPGKKASISYRRLGRSARPRLEAPPPARARDGDHGGQPAGRPGAALDVEVPDGRRRRPAELGPAAEAGDGRRRGDDRRRGDVVRQLPDSRRGRAARHHRHAQGGRGARDAPADPLFRFDEDRHPHLADHDRRRGHQEPRRHRPGAADRFDADRGHGADHPHLSELAADRGDDPGARHVRLRHGHRVQAPAPAVPRTRPDQRRGDRAARRNPRRCPHRQGVHGGKARGARVRQGRASPLPQRRALDDRRVGGRRVLGAGHRR